MGGMINMNIVYSTDENYAVHAYISINSLLENNKDIELIVIYIISNRLSMQTKKLFKDLVNSFKSDDVSRELRFLDFVEYEHYVLNAKPCGSLSTYGRIFLTEYLDVEKVLYIDCDTIILGSIKDLYNTELDDYAVAGVQDIVAYQKRKPLGLKTTDRYINAGICLINLNYWRSNNSMKRCLNIINAFDGNVPFEDQGTINAVFCGKIKIIHPKFNFMNHMIHMSASKISLTADVDNYYSNDDIKNANINPVIVHYTAGYYSRPWYQNSRHPFKDEYIKYYKKSPWKNINLKKTKHTPFSKFFRHYLIVFTPYFILKIIYKIKRSYKD